MFYSEKEFKEFLKRKNWTIVRSDNMSMPLKMDDVTYNLDCYTMEYDFAKCKVPLFIYVDDFNFFMQFRSLSDFNKVESLMDLSAEWRSDLLNVNGEEYAEFLLKTVRVKKGSVVDILEEKCTEYPEKEKELKKDAIAKITELSKIEQNMILWLSRSENEGKIS